MLVFQKAGAPQPSGASPRLRNPSASIDHPVRPPGAGQAQDDVSPRRAELWPASGVRRPESAWPVLLLGTSTTGGPGAHTTSTIGGGAQIHTNTQRPGPPVPAPSAPFRRPFRRRIGRHLIPGAALSPHSRSRTTRQLSPTSQRDADGGRRRGCQGLVQDHR